MADPPEVGVAVSLKGGQWGASGPGGASGAGTDGTGDKMTAWL